MPLIVDGKLLVFGDDGTVTWKPSGGFTPREAPPQPEDPCPLHGTPWRLIKGGISKKTGKPFNAFWVCTTEGCDMRPGQQPEFVEQLPFS